MNKNLLFYNNSSKLSLSFNYDAITSYKSEVCIYKIHDAINAGGAKIKIDPSEYNI